MFTLSSNIITTQYQIKSSDGLEGYIDSKGIRQIHRRKIHLELLNTWRTLAYEIAGGYKGVLGNT